MPQPCSFPLWRKARPMLNPADYTSDADKLACVIINELIEERPPGGKIYASVLQRNADASMFYSGILQLGDIVTKVGFLAENGTLHGFIDEPGTAKQKLNDRNDA